MIKLYEIMKQYEDLATFDMDTDEDVTAFRQLLSVVEGTFDEKAENYCKVIQSLEAESEAFKLEAEKLLKKEKSLNNRAKVMKEYLQFEASKIIEVGDKRKVGLFTLSMRQNPESLELFNPSLVPEKYKKMVEVIQNADIKKALQDGETIDGARLTRGTSFRIS